MVYEDNVREGADTPHCYKKIAIIYRSRKQYDNEIKILKRALKNVHSSGDDVKRLKKAEEIKLKIIIYVKTKS